MPELPEVETYARDLAAVLPGRVFQGARVTWPRQLPLNDPASLNRDLAGRRVRTVWRRGKYIVFDLEPSGFLIVHLKMSGRLQVVAADSPPNPHAHVVLTLDRGEELRFHDPRKFGRVWLVEDADLVLGPLGPEPLAETFDLEALKARLRRRMRLKPLLLDQTVLAGLGNIYVDEALHAARLHPSRPADSLTEAELTQLHTAIREVLAKGVAARGTSFSAAGYRDLTGNLGEMQGSLMVFRRTGQPCLTCGRPITRLLLAGRATHVCEDCQR